VKVKARAAVRPDLKPSCASSTSPTSTSAGRRRDPDAELLTLIRYVDLLHPRVRRDRVGTAIYAHEQITLRLPMLGYMRFR
jgi:hypothetical protein